MSTMDDKLATSPYKIGQEFYRVIDKACWDSTARYRPFGSHAVKASVYVETFYVFKLTPKGAWVSTLEPEEYELRKEQASRRVSEFYCWLAPEKHLVLPNSRRFFETRRLALECAVEKRKYHLKMHRRRGQLIEGRLEALTAELEKMTEEKR